MNHKIIELKKQESELLLELKKMDISVSKLKSIDEVKEAASSLELKKQKLELVQNQIKTLDVVPVELQAVETKSMAHTKKTSPYLGKTIKGVKITQEIKSFIDALQGKAADPAKTDNTVASGGNTDLLIPPAIAKGIVDIVRSESDILSIVKVHNTLAAKWEQKVGQTGLSATWTDEAGTITPSKATIKTFNLGAYGLKALTSMSNELKDWATDDFMGFILEELAEAFKEAIEEAIIKGNGSNKPKGFTSYTTGATTTMESLVSATKGAITVEEVESILANTSMKERYKKGATLVMSPATWSAICNLKGTDGHYVFEEARNRSAAQGYVLRQVKAVLSENMPQLSEGGKFSIVYGKFDKEYHVNVGREWKVDTDSSAYFEEDLMAIRGTMAIDGKIRRLEAFYAFKNKTTS